MMRRCDRFYGMNAVMKECYCFDDSLKFTGFGSTQSSRFAKFFSKRDDIKYFMFLKEFENMLTKHTLKMGTVQGRFTFCKRGQSFGIKIINAGKLEIMM